MYKMITRVLTHLSKNLPLVLVILLSSSWALQSQDVSYTCRCKETLADGVIEFKIRAFGDTNSSFTLANAVNLYFDAALSQPVTNGTIIPDVSPAGGNENFCFSGFASDGITPTVDVVENGNVMVNLQMITCRTPTVEIRPEEPEPADVCVGSARRFCIEDVYGSLTNITWTAVGSTTPAPASTSSCVTLEYSAPGTYIINVEGETLTGCEFNDDLIIFVTDISNTLDIQGECDIYTCSASLDQDYILGGSEGMSTDFKLYTTTASGGIGTLLSTTTGSGTGSGAGPSMTLTPITFPAADADYILVACNSDPNPTSCEFEVAKDIRVRTTIDYVEILGPSCTCTDRLHTFTIDSPGDFNNITWTVSPATGWSITPVSGIGSVVDILFTDAGSYTVSATGTAIVGHPHEGCTFVTDYQVEVTDEQINFIACNNRVNVSLNNNCELDITPEMVLEGNHLCNDAYTLLIEDEAGNEITGAITQNLLGETLTVTVEQVCGNNSCWGYLTVEDKSITPLECPDGPISSLCFEYDDFSDFDNIVGLPLFDPGVTAVYNPNTSTWLVSGHDNCSDVILEVNDVNNSTNCDAVQDITRTWTITDVSNGATYSCSVELSVVSLMSDAITWPKNWDSALDQTFTENCESLDACNEANPTALGCLVYTLDDYGNPHPDCTGEPTGLLCSNLQIIGYKDTVLPICGPSKKILRNWTVWDECTQVESKHTQIITLMNLSTPVCIAPADETFTAGTHSCTGDITIPPPIVTGACLPLKYTVSYNYVRVGLNVDDFVTTGVSSAAADLDESIVIKDLDFTNDSIWIRYIVTDECGMPIETVGCILEASLIDTEQPVPACDLNNVVALNEDGCAFAGPATFDDHSWDNCGIYQTVIQRMDQNRCNNFCTTVDDCQIRQYDFMRYLGSYTDEDDNTHYYYMSKETVRSQFANAYASALGETADGESEGYLVNVGSTEEGTWLDEQITVYTNDPYHTSATHAQYLINTGQNFYGRYIVEFTTRCGWTQQEKFCCNDCGEETMMMMRVIDNYGNHNFCMVNVRVEDYIAPTFTSCPADMTVECDAVMDFDTQSLNILFGSPRATDFECAAPEVTASTHTDPRDECNRGSFTRTWSVKDKSDNSGGICSQTIRFVNTDPFTGADIVWPEDAEINSGCTLKDIDPLALPLLSQGPTWTDKSCSTVVANYSDLLFTIVDGACQKLVRTWNVVDWCNPTVIYKRDQVIKLQNTTAPTVNCPSTLTFGGSLTNCERSISGLDATLGGGDACTNSVIWSHSIEYADGRTVTSDGSNADGIYSVGSHIITYKVIDACKNEGSCTTTIRVTDDTAPSPYCHGELVLPISTIAGVEIWASDIDLGSTDDCSNPVALSFSETSVVTSLTLTCDMIGENFVSLYVIDGSGNISSCITKLIIQDNLDICGGSRPLANIEGNIRTENDNMVSDVEMNLMSAYMNAPQTMMAEDGEYTFNSLPMYEDYQVQAAKDDNYLNGISTLDLIMIQRHILGIELLDSPYKVIAADINNSQRIDGLDLVELRKLVLGIYTELPQNHSWRFVNSSYEFPAPMTPWPYNEDVLVDNISHNVLDANFIGVKIGDVNLSAITTLSERKLPTTNAASLEIEILEIPTDKGNTRIQLVATSDAQLLGNQMSFDFDASELLAVVPMNIEISEDNIAWDETHNGELKLSYNNLDGINVNAGDVLVEFLFKGSDINLRSNDKISPEIYTMNDQKIETRQIKFVQSQGKSLTLEQNIPNPFKDFTVIGFNLPQASKVILTLSDVNGSLIERRENYYKAGFNEIKLTSEEIGVSGLVYYQLSTENSTLIKKMIVLK